MMHQLRFTLYAVTWWRLGAILHVMWVVVLICGMMFLTPLADLVRIFRPDLPGSAPEAYVANTAISAILLLFTLGVIALGIASALQLHENRIESRIRRGLCPKCSYPVGASEVCTECGAAVVKQEADTQKAEIA